MRVGRRGQAVAAVVVLSTVIGAGCSLMGLDTGDGGTCAPAELCGNGIDDDCNGLTDCADPICKAAGYACLPTELPAGSTLVAYYPSANGTALPACPSMYGPAQTVLANVDGGTSCDCTCAGTDAVCSSIASYHAYADGCGKDSGITSSGFTATNVCQGGDPAGPAGGSYALYGVEPPTITQGVCSGTPVTLPGPGGDQGEICPAQSTSDGGCGGAECRLSPGVGFHTCALMPTTIAGCPASGFSQQVIVSTGNPGYVDTRSCVGCQCGTSLICNGLDHLALYESSQTCRGTPDDIIDAGCGGAHATAAKSWVGVFDASGSAACEQTQAGTIDGGVTLDMNTRALCCLP
jgi:hypothetical protein